MSTIQLNSSNLQSYIYNVLLSAEGSASNEFVPQFAGGSSGLSFGFMQNDVAHQTTPLSTGLTAAQLLQESLVAYGQATGLTSAQATAQATALVSIAATPGVAISSFTSIQLTFIENALAANAAAVQAQDQAQAAYVTGLVMNLITTAAGFTGGAGVLSVNNLDPTSIAYIASWINRTGVPNTMTAALSVAASTTPVTLSDITTYLSQVTAQFTVLGESFTNYQTLINTAATSAQSALSLNGPVTNFIDVGGSLATSTYDISATGGPLTLTVAAPSAAYSTATGIMTGVTTSSTPVTAVLGGSTDLSGTAGNIYVFSDGTTVNLGSGAAASISNASTTTSVIGTSNVSLTVDGQPATVNLGLGASVTYNATGGSITTGGNSNVSVYGNNDSVTNGGTACTDGIHCTGGTVSSTDGTVDLDSGSGVTVDGNSDLIDAGNTATVTADGSQDIVEGGSYDLITQQGNFYTDTIGSSSTIYDTTANITDILNGSNVTAYAAAGDTIDGTGSNQSLNFADGGTYNEEGANTTATIVNQAGLATIDLTAIGDYAGLIGGMNYTVLGDNAGVTVNLVSTNATIDGSGGWIGMFGNSNTLTASGEDMEAVAGNQNDAVIGTGDTLDQVGGTEVNFSGGGDTINFSGASNETNLSGSGYKIYYDDASDIANLAANTSATVDSSSSGGTLTLAGGDTVIAANETVDVLGSSSDTINGNDVSVFGQAGDNITQGGAGDVDTITNATVTNGATVTDTATNAIDTINGSYVTAIAAAGDTIDGTGYGQAINFQNGGTYNEEGASTNATIVNNAGAATIDLTAIGDYAGLIGGYNYTVLGDNPGEIVNLVSTNATIDGSGGWIGLFGNSNTLTTSNEAMEAVPGSQNDVIVGTGDTMNQAGSAQVSFVGGADTIDLSGSSNTLSLSGAGYSIYYDDASDVAKLAANTSATVDSSSSGGTLTLSGGDTVIAANETVDVQANSTDTINGNNVAVFSQAGDTITQGGAGDIDTMANGGTVTDTATNAIDTINGSYVTAIAAAGDTIDGTGFAQTIAFQDGGTYNEEGANTNATIVNNAGAATIDLTAIGDYAGLIGGYNYTVLGDNAGESVNLVSTNATIDGSGGWIGMFGNSNTLTASGEAMEAVPGSQNDIVVGTGDTMNQVGNSQVSFAGGADTIDFSGTSNILSLSGAGYSIYYDDASDVAKLAANTSATVDSSSSGGTLTLAGGDTVIAANETVDVQANSADTINGNNVAVFSQAGDAITQGGAGDIDTMANGGTVTETAANAIEAINGSYVTAFAAAGDTIDGSGFSQAITFQNGGTYNEESANTNATVINNAGFATVDLAFSGDYAELNGGVGYTVLGDNAGESVNLVSTHATIDGSGGLIGMIGNSNTLTASGETMNVAAGSTNDSIVGTGDTLSMAGTSAVNLSGGTDTINFSGSNNTANITGSGYNIYNDNAGDVANLATSSIATVNSGSGGTLTLAGFDTVNATGETVDIAAGQNNNVNGNNVSVFAAAGDAIYQGGFGDIDTLTGGGQIYENATNLTATINGSNISVTGMAGTALTQTGSGDIDQLLSGGSIIDTMANATNTINGASVSVTAAAGDIITQNNTGDTDTFLNGGTLMEAASNGSDTVNGNNVTVTDNLGRLILTETGSGDIDNVTNSTIIDSMAGATNTINGNNVTVTAAGGDVLAQSGSGDVDTMANGGTVTDTAINATDTIDGSGVTVFAAAGDTINETGTNSTANIYDEAGTITVNLAGAGDETELMGGTGFTVLSDTAGETVNLAANTSATINGAGGAVEFIGNYDTATTNTQTIGIAAIGDEYDAVIGSNDTINLAPSSYVTAWGSFNTIGFSGTQSNVYLNGIGETVNEAYSGNYVNLGANAEVTVTGTNSVEEFVGAGGTLFASGATINSAVGDFGETIVGNSNTFYMVSGESAVLSGSGENVQLNVGVGVILAGGYGDVVGSAYSNVGNLSISNSVSFGMDSGGVVYGTGVMDLLGAGDVVSAYNDTINAEGGTGTVSGADDTIQVFGSGGNIDLGGGTGYTVLGSLNTIDTNADTGFTVQGSYDILQLGPMAGAGIAGNDNIVDENGGTVIFASGTAESGTISGGTIELMGSSQGSFVANGDTVINNGVAVVSGNSNDVISTSGAITINGAGDFGTIENSALTLDSGSVANLVTSNDRITNTGSVILNGNSLDVNSTAGSVALSGTADVGTVTNSAVTIDSTAQVDFNGGNSYIFNTGVLQLGGNDFTLNSTAGDLTIDGIDETGIVSNTDLTLGTGTGADLTGSGDTGSIASGGDINFDGSSSTFGAGNDEVISNASGDDNSFILGSSSVITLGSDTAGGTFSSDALQHPDVVAQATSTGGVTGDVIHASGDNIVLSGVDSVTIIGSNDKITGNYDTITIKGSMDVTIGNYNTVGAAGANDFTAGTGNVDQGSEYNGPYTSTGPFGYFGFSAAVNEKNSSPVDVIAQYDSTHGYPQAASAATVAFGQAVAAGAGDFATSSATLSRQPAAAFWTDDTITWSFAAGPSEGASPFSGSVEAQEQTVIEGALQAWSTASGLAFQQVGTSATPDITIGWGDFETPSTSVVGYTTANQSGNWMLPGAVLRLEDPTETPLVDDAAGNLTYQNTGVTLYQAALHEIGHALGLADDSDHNSVMYSTLGSANTTLDNTDVAAIQQLYGAGGVASAFMAIKPSAENAATLLAQAMASFGVPMPTPDMGVTIVPQTPQTTLTSNALH
jgi:predicted Zn-dependent protease